MSEHPIALVTALPDELSGLSRCVRDADVVLLSAGLGAERMRMTMESVLKMHRPRLVLHVGYCGALAASLQVGEVIIADRVLSGERNSAQHMDTQLVRAARECAQQANVRATCGALLTTDRIVSSPEQKAQLHASTGAIAVDMESATLAHVCAAAHTPCLIVRAVSDTAQQTLPDLSFMMTSAGRPRIARLLGALLQRPTLLVDVVQLARSTACARKAYGAFVSAWVKETIVRSEPVEG